MLWPNGVPTGVTASVSASVTLGGYVIVSVKGPSGYTCGGTLYYPDNRSSAALTARALSGTTVTWSEYVPATMATGSAAVNLWCQRGAAEFIGSATYKVVQPAPNSNWSLSAAVRSASTSDVTLAITGPIYANCQIVVGQGHWGGYLGVSPASGTVTWPFDLGPFASGTYAYSVTCTYASVSKTVKGSFVVP